VGDVVILVIVEHFGSGQITSSATEDKKDHQDYPANSTHEKVNNCKSL